MSTSKPHLTHPAPRHRVRHRPADLVRVAGRGAVSLAIVVAVVLLYLAVLTRGALL